MKKSKGFTLIEMLLFVFVTAVAIVILLGILSNFFRTRGTTSQISALENVAAYSFNDLTQEIHWSKAVNFTPSGIELEQEDAAGNPVTIEYSHQIGAGGVGRLYKNGEPLSPPEVDVKNFQITNLSPAGQVPCLQISLELEYFQSQPLIFAEHQTTISLRKMQL